MMNEYRPGTDQSEDTYLESPSIRFGERTIVRQFDQISAQRWSILCEERRRLVDQFTQWLPDEA